MNAYRFDVKVGKDGSIRIPSLSDLINQEAEVIVIPKKHLEVKSKDQKKGQNFLKTWTGFISENNGTESRLDI